MAEGLPRRETFIALRASREAHRLATEVLLDRVVGLDTLRCVRCGQAVAVATDAAHRAKDFEGRVVCRACIRAEALPRLIVWDTPEPPLNLCLEEIQRWVDEGFIVLPMAPDPRPTLWQWVRRRFARPSGRRSG